VANDQIRARNVGSCSQIYSRDSGFFSRSAAGT
jgi:hypothetical protein